MFYCLVPFRFTQQNVMSPIELPKYDTTPGSILALQLPFAFRNSFVVVTRRIALRMIHCSSILGICNLFNGLGDWTAVTYFSVFSSSNGTLFRIFAVTD